MNRERFLSKAREKHGSYTYPELPDMVDISDHITITCKIHGEFSQRIKNHLQGYGCAACALDRARERYLLGKEAFIKKAKEVHGDAYDYSYVEYSGNKKPVTVVCPTHGIFTPTPNNHMRGTGCPQCSKKRITGRPAKLTQNFVEQAIRVHGDTYIYDKTSYKNSEDTVTITCKIHGDFQQLPANHLSGRGCLKCGQDTANQKKRRTTTEFINLARAVHGDRYEYAPSNYSSARDGVDILCKRHGVFTQNAQTHLQGSGCPRCGVVISNPHQKVIDLLSKHYTDIKVNDRKTLNGLELDVYLPSVGLAIEIDGLYYHSSKFINDKHKAQRKHELANAKGITLLSFWDDEINNKFDIVESMILSKLGLLEKKIYARKTKVVELSQQEYGDFLDKSHLQGKIASSKRLGLVYNDKVVSVLGVSKRGKEFHIDRFSSLPGIMVVGGFTKLLKHLDYDDNLVSFSFNRYSSGNVYRSAGFTLLHENKNSLFFTDGITLFDRHLFMKHKLEKRFGKSLDLTKTALQLCEENGIYAVWSAGVKKWLLPKKV